MAIATLALLAGLGIIDQLSGKVPEPSEDMARNIACTQPRVIDGDTIDCSGTRIRLAGIDAPEMPGHCRPGRVCTPGDPHAAAAALRVLSRGKVSCAAEGTDAYDRTIARCTANGHDLSCAMLANGHAVSRYGRINC